MGAVESFFTGWLFCAAFMAALYLVQRLRGEADIVDAGWALSIGLLAFYYAQVMDGYPTRKLLVALFAGLWSFRLAAYLISNRVMKPGEDGRYQKLREQWGNKAQRNFFLFFQGQALLASILTIPFLVVMSNPVPAFTIMDVLAGMLFVAAIGGELLADIQLAQFRADPNNKGKVCSVGLWRYSRHPNYFFEWLHWFTYVALAWYGSYWFLTLVSPMIMLYLLWYVTGIPPTEARSLQTRGDAYREYQRTTSPFFPWFPKQ